MLHVSSVILLSFCFASLAICSEPPEFTDDDFKTRINEKEFILVMFYAPWCGHCNKLKPAFQAARTSVIGRRDNIEFARVDCTVHSVTCGEFGVQGYPTLKYFSNGKLLADPSDLRDEASLEKYALDHSKAPITELTSKEQLQKEFNDEDSTFKPLVLAFITEKYLQKLKDCASTMIGKAIFLYTVKSDVSDLHEGTIRIYRPKALTTKLEESSVETSIKDLSAEDLSRWIFKNGQGLIGYRDRDNEEFFPPKNVLVFFNNASLKTYAKGVNYYRNRLMKLIRSNPLGDNFVYAYSFSEDYHHELDDMHLMESGKLPAVVIYSSGKKYILDNYSPESFATFITKYQAGALTPYVKSEAIPKEQEGSTVKVVGHTFDSVVNDPLKDVFIVFHAPWCGHCKSLIPKFKEAAEKLKTESGVLFALYDATANEVPEPYTVQGFPTIYFVPKDRKSKPEIYKGGREVNDLIQFVAKASTDQLSGYDRNGNPMNAEL